MKDLVPEQTIGNYRVIRRIGRGGMGSVYEVESLDLYERYALKTFTYDPKDDDGDVLKNKFLEEGKILARLRHPNIAHVYSLAYDQGLELLYFVMDLVLSEDGRPYSVENASFADLEEDTALAWFTDVCEALDYIHSQGIVHRDIKPGNLLVKQDGHIVLTDFGIAKIKSGKMKAEVNPAMTMRIDGNITILGSNHYMAPEVEYGGEVTPAADAYSLGVMMFEMLTGKWYDKVEDPWSLLDGRKYPWKRVLSMLLAEDPSDRPLGYAEIAKRMPTWKGEDAPVIFEKKEASVPESKKRILPLLLIAGVVVIGLVVAAVCLLKSDEEPKIESAVSPVVVQPQEEIESETFKESDEDESNLEPMVSVEESQSVENVTPEAPGEKPSPKSEEVKKPEAKPVLPKKPEAKPVPPKKPEAKSVPAKKPSAPVVSKPQPKKIDYGPIPKRTYAWFNGGRTAAPKAVVFELANGVNIELRPYAPKANYLMKDAWDMGTHAHMVEFSRPYWISAFCIEPSVFREFDAKGFEDCREIESVVKNKYRVYRSVGYRKIRKFCEFLTDKYRSQLPPGYVFRLPTEAEWDRAIDSEGYKELVAKAKLPRWTDMTSYNSGKMRGEFAAIRKDLGLDRFGKWESLPTQSGFLIGKGILIGGRSLPSPNGVSDVAFGTQPLLDALPVGTDLIYAESEVDPLQGADGLDVGDVSKARVLCRRWSSERLCMDAGCSFVFHLALGPDLVGEQAWNKRIVSENPAAVKPPAGHYDWNPMRIQSKLSRPKEIDLRLVNGAKMTFCAVPKGKFTMSNVPGQEDKSHKVELTYAFWMSKYCVTSEQRRDFGKYDCEGTCRTVEKAFPGDPVYCAFNRKEWEAYCRFLTERYRAQIPEGYVFRLPTEAEYEWVFIADEKTEVRTVNTKHNPGDRKVMDRFAKRMKRDGLSLVRDMDGRGFVGPANLCLGGISEPNVWGIHDVWLDDWTQWTADLYDYDGKGVPGGRPEINVFYNDREKDPFHWDGRVSRGGIVRYGRSGRSLCPFNYEARAHIVLAPDFVTPLEKTEREPCPESAFGGKFVESVSVSVLSSEQNPAKFTPERKAMLVSRDPAILGDRGRAFLTQEEDAPWVQLELAQRTTLAGAVIETYASRGQTANLTVWISDDGKRWREIAKADRVLGRYRFDFKGKNANRVKYVRVGREPGHGVDSFGLHKVWLYGKK